MTGHDAGVRTNNLVAPTKPYPTIRLFLKKKRKPYPTIQLFLKIKRKSYPMIQLFLKKKRKSYPTNQLFLKKKRKPYPSNALFLKKKRKPYPMIQLFLKKKRKPYPANSAIPEDFGQTIPHAFLIQSGSRQTWPASQTPHLQRTVQMSDLGLHLAQFFEVYKIKKNEQDECDSKDD